MEISPTDEVIRFGICDDQIEAASLEEMKRIAADLLASSARLYRTNDGRIKFWTDLYRFRSFVAEIDKLQIRDWEELKVKVWDAALTHTSTPSSNWVNQVFKEIGLWPFSNPIPDHIIDEVTSIGLKETGSALLEGSKIEDPRAAERMVREAVKKKVSESIARLAASELLALSPQERFNLLFRVPANDSPIPALLLERRSVWRPLQSALRESYGPEEGISWPEEKELAEMIFRAMKATSSLGAPNSFSLSNKRFSAHLAALLFPEAVRATLKALNGFQLDDSFDRIWIEEYPDLAPR